MSKINPTIYEESKGIYEEIKALWEADRVEIASRESDLMCQITDETREIIGRYEFKEQVETLTKQAEDGTNEQWYLIPFAYQPYWKAKTAHPMPEYRIRIATGNDAFYPDPCPEIASILHRLAERIEEGGTGRPGEGLNLRDVDGNKVGVANWK